MSRPKWVQEIEEQAGGKPVLLVEGNTDIAILAYFLEKVSPGWNARIVMSPAGKKDRVIKGIGDYHPEWAGIVDKDEWQSDQIQQELMQTPRVKALSRFCLENYFCIPEELWAALPPGQQEKLGNDSNLLAQPILTALPDWVAHGAM